MRRPQHFHEAQPSFSRQSNLPGLLKFLSDFCIVHRLIARQASRQHAHVAGPLNVVLASQGIEATTFHPQTAGEHSQVGQGPYAIHCTDVVGDARPIENTRRVSFSLGPHLSQRTIVDRRHLVLGIAPARGKEPRRSDNVLRRHSRDLRYVIEVVLLQREQEWIETLAVLAGESAVPEIGIQDDSHHAIDKGHVRARVMAQPDMGKTAQVNLAGIGHDELGPFAHRPLDT